MGTRARYRLDTLVARSPDREWISDAKGEDTRKRRVDTAVEWMAEGKSRNWKYEKR
ncbi:MAG TPA: YdeI/OmpD-associated family protein [Gemmatimonadaceae bacterium]|nr:YdeI/OmpD-associated family protein [Gemmatimonadaceae bacterium]